ncbi:hypothetical protein [Nonomuraea aridisoli]|uniref:hypothetical protein n=1 Tax=Nonomuraea aridisoli TaxID=2070368 RepID=UPI001F1F11F9|nr:hypothetical protein [Nonomuraea aridisoli]
MHPPFHRLAPRRERLRLPSDEILQVRVAEVAVVHAPVRAVVGPGHRAVALDDRAERREAGDPAAHLRLVLLHARQSSRRTRV